MIVELGTLEVGVAVPGCATAVAAGEAGITGALPDIQSRISALQAALSVPMVPISFEAQKLIAAQLVVSLTAAIDGGLPVPSIDAQFFALTALMTELLATVTSINAQLDVLIDLKTPLGVDGVEAYAYDGALEDFAGELDAELGADAAHCNALVLIARSPVTWDALSNIMKVTP